MRQYLRFSGENNPVIAAKAAIQRPHDWTLYLGRCVHHSLYHSAPAEPSLNAGYRPVPHVKQPDVAPGHFSHSMSDAASSLSAIPSSA